MIYCARIWDQGRIRQFYRTSEFKGPPLIALWIWAYTYAKKAEQLYHKEQKLIEGHSCLDACNISYYRRITLYIEYGASKYVTRCIGKGGLVCITYIYKYWPTWQDKYPTTAKAEIRMSAYIPQWHQYVRCTTAYCISSYFTSNWAIDY